MLDGSGFVVEEAGVDGVLKLHVLLPWVALRVAAVSSVTAVAEQLVGELHATEYALHAGAMGTIL